MLSLNDATIRRGGTVIVRRLDLRILPGRIFWVTGPNGAGKSSLLRVLARVDRPESGSVTAEPGDFAYFHTEMTLPPSALVAEWALLGDRLLADPLLADRLLPGHSAAGRPTPVRTPLWPAVDPRRPVGRLSTGERKRLLLDVLLRRGRPLLLDEPYEHLSPEAKAALTLILEERARSSVVVVATNQWPERTPSPVGLRLQGGAAEPIEGPGVVP